MRGVTTSDVGRCPDCGKLVAFYFPIHDCTPTPNFKREKKAVTENTGNKLPKPQYITGKTRFKTLKGLVRRCMKAGATDAGVDDAGNFSVWWPEGLRVYAMYGHTTKKGCMEIDIQLYFDLKG
jgi:hypothetical protein